MKLYTLSALYMLDITHSGHQTISLDLGHDSVNGKESDSPDSISGFLLSSSIAYSLFNFLVLQ